MPVTLDATVGGANSNTYETEAEADTYFLARLPLNPPWSAAADPTAALAMATRTLESTYRQRRVYIPASSSEQSHWLTTKGWAGSPATSTQRLAWPRVGMLDGNGNAIPSNVIPQALKDAESEFAGQLVITDWTLNNDVITQGLLSVKAGSVALSFKDGFQKVVIPDAVLALMPPWWFTDEIIEPVYNIALFDVI